MGRTATRIGLGLGTMGLTEQLRLGQQLISGPMGMSMPDPPRPPDLPGEPQRADQSPPGTETPEERRRRQRQTLLSQAMTQGRAGTQLTSPLGLTDQPPLGARTLLGGL